MSVFGRRKPSFDLHVLIHEENGVWVAHCLEMDIVTAHKEQSTVENDIIDLIRAQIESAIEHGNMENIFKPAPSEDWAKLYSASKACNHRKLKKPDKFPIKGVEFCFA